MHGRDRENLNGERRRTASPSSIKPFPRQGRENGAAGGGQVLGHTPSRIDSLPCGD